MLLTIHHLGVGAVGDGEEMRRHLVPPLADVHLDHRVRVDRVALVRVDHHAEQARVGLQIAKVFIFVSSKLDSK